MKYNSRGTDYNRKSPSLLHTATSRYNTQNDAMKSQKYVSGSAPSLDQLKILHKIPPQKHSPTIPAVVCAQRHAATRHFEPLIAARQLQHVGRCTIRRFRRSSGARHGGRRLRKPVEAARDPAKNVSTLHGGAGEEEHPGTLIRDGGVHAKLIAHAWLAGPQQILEEKQAFVFQ